MGLGSPNLGFFAFFWDYKEDFRFLNTLGVEKDNFPQVMALTMKGQNIGSSTKNFTRKYLIPTYWVVRNEHICLSGLLKAMPIALLLKMAE